MTVLRIREAPGLTGGANAELSFDYADTYPITITDPFAAAEEARLAWYFEDWLRFPFVEQIRARTAAESTITYGEALFGQLFAQPQAYSRYRQADLTHLRIEIAGSPTFHRLHWEALKDPPLPQPLALRAPMVRKNLQPPPVTVKSSPPALLHHLFQIAVARRVSQIPTHTGQDDVFLEAMSFEINEGVCGMPVTRALG